MLGQPFTRCFLTDDIEATAGWRTSVADSAADPTFSDGVRQRYDALSGSGNPNESVIGQELMTPWAGKSSSLGSQYPPAF